MHTPTAGHTGGCVEIEKTVQNIHLRYYEVCCDRSKRRGDCRGCKGERGSYAENARDMQFRDKRHDKGRACNGAA